MAGRDIAANGFSLLIIAAIAVAGLAGWARNEIVREGPLEQPIYFDVARGASLRAVSENLDEAGAVSSGLLFRLNAQYSDRAADLRFGTYELPAGASMTDILDIVTDASQTVERYTATYFATVDGRGEMRLIERVPGSGQIEEIAEFSFQDGTPDAYSDIVAQGGVAFRVAIPPGLTSWQIAESLSVAEFLSGEIGDRPDEGSLAPDTYGVSPGDDRAALIAEMQASQAETLAELWENRAENLPFDTPEEALIMASIIEKETGVADERRLIAGVFENRLRQGMRLQTDPTVIYGASDGRGYLGRDIRRSELDTDHPWNTYQIDGLPPTPIANPGRASIEAALNPEPTDYLFFVADGTGGHAFAETNAEHEENVARWRALQAEQGDDG
ncbi:endolytic transglycosylase MltG [Rhodobacterales bacterium HKCCE3408]|nr:endolytic transglycosylase MltG [Rhodobacterales bacterium HKCCE3408]